MRHDVKLLFEAEAKTLRPRPESLEADVEAEARSSRPRPRPRPDFWPRGQSGIEALTSLHNELSERSIFVMNKTKIKLDGNISRISLK